MTRLTLAFVIIAFFGVFGDARHIHAVELLDSDAEPLSMESKADIEGISIDTIHEIKPGFVPMNNIMFFKTYPLCEDGFKRDVLGVCREVWD